MVEYITAMRVEIERKKLVATNTDPVRVAELACLMTLCNMENAHKFLAFKNAFTLLYKMGNFITAAHFARQIVSLEPHGVSQQTINSIFVDFRKQARYRTPIQKVLLSLLD